QQVGADGVDHPEAQRAGQRILAGGGNFMDLRGLHQYLRGLRADTAAGFGDLHLGGAALEQLHAELFLDLLDRHGKRGLADMALFRGPPEVAFAGQRDEIAEVGERHGGPCRAGAGRLLRMSDVTPSAGFCAGRDKAIYCEAVREAPDGILSMTSARWAKSDKACPGNTSLA